jgi:hypothetical protein
MDDAVGGHFRPVRIMLCEFLLVSGQEFRKCHTSVRLFDFCLR